MPRDISLSDSKCLTGRHEFNETWDNHEHNAYGINIRRNNTKYDCTYTFPIDLNPNGYDCVYDLRRIMIMR